ncbi:MAG TPA: hypothetical protein V6C89_00325 [Drouetiella sp.]|jgi:hypothetical protein
MAAIADTPFLHNSSIHLAEIWGGSSKSGDNRTSLNKLCRQTFFSSKPTVEDFKSEAIIGTIEANPPAQVTVTESVLKEIKLFAQNSCLIDKAIFALVHSVDARLFNSVLSQSQKSIVKEMNESAVELIELGFTLKQDDGIKNGTIDCSPENQFSYAPGRTVDGFHSAFQMRLLANALMSL